MTKVLIIGNSPLPTDNAEMRPAAGLRTYQFLKACRSAGFDVQLVTVAMAASEASEDGQIILLKDDPRLMRRLQVACDEFGPDLILGVNTFPSSLACGLRSDAPLWADLNGWVMSEAQAQAYKLGSNDYLGHYFAMERRIIRRADKFSAVSVPQKHALLGELASAGRLNRESFGYEFVHHVANGTEWFKGEKEASEGDILAKIPRNKFVALWLGGYNTWVDEKMLFKGMEDAMAECDDLVYVSTGGRIKGLDNETFLRFLKMVDGSRFKDRFVFLGWVDTEDIPGIYGRSDVGLNVDRRCVETLTGARNRINEMMKFRLPVVTTLGSEISYECVAAEAGLGVESGDAEGLTAALMEMYQADEDRLEAFGRRGRDYILRECGYERLGVEFVEWARDAKRAPDYSVKVDLGRGAGVKGGLRYLRENGVGKFFKKLWQKIRG